MQSLITLITNVAEPISLEVLLTTAKKAYNSELYISLFLAKIPQMIWSFGREILATLCFIILLKSLLKGVGICSFKL